MSEIGVCGYHYRCGIWVQLEVLHLLKYPLIPYELDNKT